MIQAIDLLMSRGHKYHDLLYTYSYELFEELHLAAIINMKDSVKDFTIGIRTAHHGNEKQFKKYINNDVMKKKPKRKKQSKEDTKKDINKIRNFLKAK